METSGQLTLSFRNRTKNLCKVGADLSTEQGYEAARATGLEIIAVLKAATGDLSRMKQFVKVLGMVNATPEFTAQPL